MVKVNGFVYGYCVSHRSPLKYITCVLLIGGGNDGKRQQARYCSVIYHQCLGSAAGGYGKTGWNHVSHRTIMDIKRWQLQVRLHLRCSVQIHKMSVGNARDFTLSPLNSIGHICSSFLLSLSFCLGGQLRVNCGFSGSKNLLYICFRV